MLKQAFIKRQIAQLIEWKANGFDHREVYWKTISPQVEKGQVKAETLTINITLERDHDDAIVSYEIIGFATGLLLSSKKTQTYQLNIRRNTEYMIREEIDLALLKLKRMQTQNNSLG